MILAPIPLNESQRRLDLLKYDILDSEDEEDYEQLADLAASICNCPMALVTFVDSDRQWFKATKNIKLKELPRNTSFCGHVIVQDEVMVVNDTLNDQRFHDNPHVLDSLKIGFYAGAPIISTNGYNLGSVCVIDNQPKSLFPEEQKEALRVISRQITRLLELRIKNKLIKEQSAALLKYEKNTAKQNTILREKENNQIAYELHENIAQVLAVSRMHLDSVSLQKTIKSEALDPLKNYLTLLMQDVKALSNSITPTTFYAADYTDYITALITDFGRENNVRIIFNKSTEALQLSGTLGLTIFRIIQHQLNYGKLAGATEVVFNLNTSINTLLSFTHNGNNNLSLSEEADLILNNIHTRADIIRTKLKINQHLHTMEITHDPHDH